MTSEIVDMQEFVALLRTLKPADKAHVVGQMHRLLDEQEAADLLWGAEAIAAYLGRTRRQVFGMLEAGQLPVAKKVGGRWCASRRALRAFFAGAAA